MKRYVTRNDSYPNRSVERTGYAGGEFLASTTNTVIEADPTAYDTGLLDSSGSPIMAADITDPVGFVHLKERR